MTGPMLLMAVLGWVDWAAAAAFWNDRRFFPVLHIPFPWMEQTPIFLLTLGRRGLPQHLGERKWRP